MKEALAHKGEPDDPACLGDVTGPLTRDEWDEWEALASLFNATNGEKWEDNTCWNAVAPVRVCCAEGGGASTWHGITCGDGFVLAIELSSYGLTGSVPHTLEGLRHIVKVDLSFNGISGVLPAIGWPALSGTATLFNAGFNRISGPLPQEVVVVNSTPNLLSLNLAGNLFEGGLEPARGFVGWYVGFSVDLSHCSRLGGTISSGALRFPRGQLGLGDIQLDLTGTGLSGTIPDDWGRGVEGGWGARLALLHLGGNPRLSGTLPPWDALFFGDNSTVQIPLDLSLAGNMRLSGSLPPITGCASDYLEELDVSGCLLSGAVSVGAARAMTSLRLSHNQFTAIHVDNSPEDGPEMPVLPKLKSLRVDRNMIASLPDALCRASSLQTLVTHNNMLGDLPPCIVNVSSLLELGVSSNRLTELVPGIWRMPSLRLLRAAANSLSFGGLHLNDTPSVVEPGSPSLVTEIDLGGNPLDTDASSVLVSIMRGFPLVSTLSLWGCGLLGSVTPGFTPVSMTSIDVSLNPQLTGLDIETADVSVLTTMDVSGTAIADLVLPTSLEVLLRANTPARTCMADFVASPLLTRLDMRGAFDGGVACTGRMRAAVRPDPTRRAFYEGLGLNCPSWVSSTTGGEVVGNVGLFALERCRCGDGMVWSPNEVVCVACPSELVRCDPYVLAPVHCVSGANVYPVAASGASPRNALPESAAGLAAAVLLPCRRPGVCNKGAGACARATFTDELHTPAAAAEPRPPGPAFSCASGHDPDSLLCSRCLPSYYETGGGACFACGRVLPWLSAAAVVVAGSLLAAFAWRSSSRAASSKGAASSVAMFWLQTSAILRASSDVHSGSSSSASSSSPAGSATWQWLEPVRDVVASWTVGRPWAMRCLVPGFDYVGRGAVVLLAPAAVAAAGALAWRLAAACSGSRSAAGGVSSTRARVLSATAWLLSTLLFPVAEQALQAFNCESAGGLRYLSAVPYVECGWSGEVGRLRALSVCVLALFVFPALVAVAAALKRRRRRSTGDCGERPARARRGGDQAAADGAAGEAGLSVGLLAVDGAGGDECDGDTDGHDSDRGSTVDRVTDTLLLAPLRDPDTLLWWPLAYTMARSMSLALVVGLVPVTSPLLPAAVFVVLALALIVHTRAQPWRRALDNTAESAVLLSALSSYLLSIVGGAESGGAGGGGMAAVRATVSLLYVLTTAFVAAAVFAPGRTSRALGLVDQH